MKRALIYLWMMIKRMGKHPAYWILLLLFPAAVFAVPKFNGITADERIVVGYVIEEAGPGQTEESEEQDCGEQENEAQDYKEEGYGEQESQRQGYQEQAYRERNYAGQLLVLLENKLAEETGGLFEYIAYSDVKNLIEDVKTGEIAGGVVFDREFPEKLRGQDYYHCIRMYLSEGMNVGGIVQEDVFQRVYQAYSAVWYMEQLEQRGYQIRPEEVLQKFSEYQNAGKVYAVNYELQDESRDYVQNVSEGEKRDSVLSLRGILAFLTLLSASLGALDAGRDKRRNIGRGISHPATLAAAAAGAPILAAVLFLAAGMLSVDIKMTDVSYAVEQEKGKGMMEYGSTQTEGGGMTEYRPASADNTAGTGGYQVTQMDDTVEVVGYGGIRAEEFLRELGSAMVYGLVLWLLAMLFARVLPQKLLEGMMPCFLLTVLLCCPVFFDLGETIPLASYISNLFPLTWYLRFWGG